MENKLTSVFLALFLSASIFVYAEKNPGSAFTENKGQFRDQHGNPNPDVLYMADFGGLKVQLRKTGFSYETYQVKPKWVDPASIPYKILTFTENGDTLESVSQQPSTTSDKNSKVRNNNSNRKANLKSKFNTRYL